MANERMRLELLLKGVDQLSGVVKKQIPLLKTLDKTALKTYNSLKKLFDLKPKGNFSGFGKQSSAEFRKANSEAAKLKKTLESIGKIKMPKIDFAENSPKINTEKARKELDKLYGGGKSNKYLNRLANLNDKFFEPTNQIKNAWREQTDSLREYTDQATRYLRLQGRFKQFNLGEAENKKVFSAVEQNTKNVRGISLADSQDLFTNVYNALRNVDDTIASLGTASKYQVGMKSLYGDMFSPEQINEQVRKAFKFLEMTGASKDRATLEDRFNVISKVVSATGGEVSFDQFVALGKQAAPIMQTVSAAGIRNTSSVIDTMGGSRVGTAIEALNRAWVGGIMPQHVAQRYADLGLIKEGGIEYGKGQKLKRIKPGANKLGEVFLKDPLEASKMLADAVRADAAKKGIDVSTPEKMNEQLRGLFGTSTQFRLAHEFINNLRQVEKEAQAAETSEGAIDTYNRSKKEDDPRLKIEEYKAALENFQTKAGIPLLQTLGKLAETTAPILQFFGEHPTVTQWGLAAMIGFKAFKGIAETASALKTSGFTSFFTNTAQSANNATTSIQNFSKESKGLKGRNIPVGLQIASVIGIDLLIRLIEWEIGKAMEAQESRNAAKNAITTGNKVWDNYVGDLSKQGKKPSNDEIDSKASVAWMSAMNLGLKDTLPSQIYKKKFFSATGDSIVGQMFNETLLYPLSPKNEFRNGFLSTRGNKEEIAQGFRTTAPELRDPQIMASFIRLLEMKIPDKKDQQTVKEGLQHFNSEAYAKAIQINAENANRVSESFMNLITPTGSVVEQFLNLQGKSSEAVTGVNNLATATSNAANRINALEFQPPTFGTINVPIPTPTPTTKPFSLFNLPGRARGGKVRRGFPYQVGEVGRELFIPETNGKIIPNDVLRGRKSGSSNVRVNFNPTINVSSDNPNASQIKQELRAEMKFLFNEFLKQLTPDKLAGQVNYAAGRYSERA